MMKLATIHNPACMRHMLLASADNLSEEQRREKYDALVVSALSSLIGLPRVQHIQARTDGTQRYSGTVVSG